MGGGAFLHHLEFVGVFWNRSWVISFIGEIWGTRSGVGTCVSRFLTLQKPNPDMKLVPAGF
jgi:hypothetical protein